MDLSLISVWHEFNWWSVMVWGGIFIEGRTDPYRLEDGSVTAIRYLDRILEPMLTP